MSEYELLATINRQQELRERFTNGEYCQADGEEYWYNDVLLTIYQYE